VLFSLGEDGGGYEALREDEDRDKVKKVSQDCLALTAYDLIRQRYEIYYLKFFISR
jgi:hypothetical protein